MKKFFFFVFLFAATLLKAQVRPLLVDDFKSGDLIISEVGIVGKPVDFFQTGTSILGGTRKINGAVTANPAKQKLQVSVLTDIGMLVVNSGYKALFSTNLIYGYDAKNNLKPLNLDITSYKYLNIEFDGITRNLNFNAILFSEGHLSSAYAENLTTIGAPFTRKIPIATYLKNTAFNPKKIIYIGFVMQSAADLCIGQSFAIKRIWFD